MGKKKKGCGCVVLALLAIALALPETAPAQQIYTKRDSIRVTPSLLFTMDADSSGVCLLNSSKLVPDSTTIRVSGVDADSVHGYLLKPGELTCFPMKRGTKLYAATDTAADSTINSLMRTTTTLYFGPLIE